MITTDYQIWLCKPDHSLPTSNMALMILWLFQGFFLFTNWGFSFFNGGLFASLYFPDCVTVFIQVIRCFRGTSLFFCMIYVIKEKKRVIKKNCRAWYDEPLLFYFAAWGNLLKWMLNSWCVMCSSSQIFSTSRFDRCFENYPETEDHVQTLGFVKKHFSYSLSCFRLCCKGIEGVCGGVCQ